MGGFAAGLVIGILIGILIGPLARSWVLWHEVTASRRETGLAEGILDRMDGTDRFDDGRS